jgi:hypothetical protein
MVNKICLLFVMAIAGCTTTVPVKPTFPEAISTLMEECPELQAVPPGTISLSETLKIVTSNYGKYHECSLKVQAWIQWYTDQSTIYNEIDFEE